MVDIAKRAEKENALREKKAVVRVYLVELQADKNAEIDRWGHVQYDLNGRRVRLKIMEKVIRREVKTSVGWKLINSLSLKDIHKKAMDKMKGNV